jgi:Ca-activated chloride channel family protein
MKTQFRLRQITLCTVAVLMATPASAPQAFAQRGDVIDGAPTPDGCGALGFKAYEREDYRGAQTSGRKAYMGSSATGAPKEMPMAGLPPPPPPPPPPPRPMVAAPPMASPMPRQESVVASGRNASGGYAQDSSLPYTGTEHYPDAVANPIHQTSAEPVSTFSIDVDTASYANVRRFLKDGQRPPAQAVRVEEMVNYFDYGYASPATKDTPFATSLAVVPSPWSQGKQLIHIGVQGFKPPKGAEPPLNLVFLVDTSGSMSSADRLPLAQKSLNVLIDQLRPQDHVSLVAYAGSAGAVLAPTSGREKLKMRCAVNALSSGGSTAGGAGLTLAYSLAQQNFDKTAVNRIILMTDGDFNVGTTDNRSLEDFVAIKRKTGVYLSIYGYGRGNYQDARMQVLAQNGNGTASYVDTLDEARKIFRDDFEGSMFPIADDVKIQVEFNPARVAEYRLVGYETRLLKREDFNNDSVDAGEVGAGVAVTALYEVTPVGGPVASDPLRYGKSTVVAASKDGELAFLKIRYKLPGGATSKLIEKPIGAGVSYASLGQAPEATRWATSVASYGQKLAGSPYVSDAFSWDDTLTLAQGARGQDPFGNRAEFIGLVRSAKDLRIQSAGR